MPEEKMNIEKTLSAINKRLGEGTIEEVSKFGEIKIDRIPTGSYSLDYIMGGGLPKGRILEIYGEPSSGKTILSLFMIKEVQQRGGKAAFIDCENSFSVDFASDIGVDTDRLILSQAVIAEDVLNIVDDLIKTNELDLIVLDSVASMVPRKEFEGEVGDMQVALTSRIMSQALRKITGSAAHSKTSVIFINQIRSKIGMYYGNPMTTPGGMALKFYASIRMQVAKGKNIEDKSGEIVGNIIKVEAKKNKTAMPFRKTELELYYKRGIDKIEDIFEMAVKNEIIAKSGNTYSFKEAKLGVGKDSVKQFLRDNPDVYQQIQEVMDQV